MASTVLRATVCSGFSFSYKRPPTLKSIPLLLQRCMSTAMRTSISVMTPARTSEFQDQETTVSRQSQHTLIVDLGDARPEAPNNSNSYGRDRTIERTEAYQAFLSRLRSVVERDCARREGSNEPRIDAIRFERVHDSDGPGELTLKALDGLQPRHLEIHCGWDESCDIAPLDELETPWPLKNIFISNACDIGLTSKYTHSITTLTLHECGCGVSVTPSSEPSALRHLTILQNNAIDIFISIRRDTDIAANIQTLKIESTTGSDFVLAYEPTDFAKMLQQCTSLLSLDLALTDKEFTIESTPDDHILSIRRDTDIAPNIHTVKVESTTGSDFVLAYEPAGTSILSLDPALTEKEFMIERTESPFDHIRHLLAYFPCNVEHLRFRAPPSLADDMSSWLRCAADPTWLPRLKTVSFRLDVSDEDHRASMSPSTQTPTVVTEFLDTLSARHPPVHIE